ncbi:guanine nucleotide exchange factor, putative [Entamoeba invadens IP1]|uniref:guanine nucleotide exchange factor, putative n=1 Tax=Entamoeba invadens IP1 TaxID=370355 RepID=UPI0002C3F5D1|nr:guanine nucleotide exchange factor, putative [Entamoeba invadens IP1]ELP85044.1 guanine nucleotide exchange factor, putative [Entamoeba invadens IP1]|eukprot:XP_004184390.1 guanine nucleotide exchange factor, putative [Entamoeba invadens IP1]
MSVPFQQLYKEKEELQAQVEKVNKEISQIKREMLGEVNIDQRMMDIIEIKKYFETVKNNVEMRKVFNTSSKMKKEKKGNYEMTLRRQKALTTKLGDNEPLYNVIEIRKQFIIDSIAREIEKISRTEEFEKPSFETTVKELVASLENQLDTDCKTNDVENLLKTFDVNSAVLRKTSTLFKVTSRLFTLEPIVEEESIGSDEERAKIEECEKTTFINITRKVADFAVAMEDAICLSAVMLGKPHIDYSEDFFDMCVQTLDSLTAFGGNVVDLLKRLSALREQKVYDTYENELSGYYNIIKTLLANQNEVNIQALTKEIENVNDIKDEFRPGDLEEIIRETALRLKMSVSYALMIAHAAAHLKPKEIGKLGEEVTEVKKKKDDKKKEESKKFNISKKLCLEKACLVEVVMLMMNVSQLLIMFYDQTRVIVALKKAERVPTTFTGNPEVIVQKNHVVSGNVGGFIDRMTSTTDQNFAELMVASFGSMMSSKEFIEKTVKAYNVGDAKVKENVMNVVEIIIYKSFGDLGLEAGKILYDFLTPLKDTKALELKVQYQRKATIRDLNIAGLLIPPINFFIPDEPIFPIEFFISCDPKEIARQMTVIDFGVYKNTKPSEFLENIPEIHKKNRVCRYSHVAQMIDRIDEVANWTSSMILIFADFKNRVAMFQKMIDIALELEQLNNFQSLAGICKGFELETVQRLGMTVKAVNSPMKHIADITKNFGFSTYSFKGYKSALDKVKDYCVPYISPLLKEIRSITQKYPSTNLFINAQQKEQILDEVNKFLRFKNNDYGFIPTEPLFVILANPTYLPIVGNNQTEESCQLQVSKLCDDS